MRKDVGYYGISGAMKLKIPYYINYEKKQNRATLNVSARHGTDKKYHIICIFYYKKIC